MESQKPTKEEILAEIKEIADLFIKWSEAYNKLYELSENSTTMMPEIVLETGRLFLAGMKQSSFIVKTCVPINLNKNT
jgi:hypothetical protein